MLTRRHLFAAAMTGLALLAASAQAMDMKPIDKAAFQAAQASGKPILVEVTAPWCPVCKVQKPILSDLMKMPSFESFAVFEVDFDSGKDVLRMLNVQKQSTLIA